MFWYNKRLVEFDLVQHQVSFSGSSDVRLTFTSPSVTCPGKTNLMLDSVSSNKCLVFVISKVSHTKRMHPETQLDICLLFAAIHEYNKKSLNYLHMYKNEF